MADNKDYKQKEIWSVSDDSLSGSWAPPAENYTVSYDTSGVGTIDSLDIGEMMRQDAGKGMENMTFEDYNVLKPFENSVPSLEKIDEMCAEYPALKIAYDKFRNVWRICYTDYCSKNPDEENF